MQTKSTIPRPIVIGVTGASGSILAFRLVGELLKLDQPVELILTQKAFPVVFEEMGLKLGSQGQERSDTVASYLKLPTDKASLLTFHESHNLGAAPSSGTHLTQGMVVIPCSMGTLGKIATGVTDNLVVRAADVTLKENRKLIVIPRESPFNQIHLRNLLTLSQCGAIIIPPVLSFYLSDFNSMEGQINYTVGKVLDQLGFEHDLYTRWGQPQPATVVQTH